MLYTLIILLLALGMLLLFLEIVVPGGIIGTFGVIMMGIGVYLCFDIFGAQQGWFALIACAAGGGIFMLVVFKLLPHSPLGRRLFLDEEASKAAGYVSESEELNTLTGCEGVAESDLRPAGIAQINGKRIDVMADGDFIKSGSRIRVTAANSNRVMVVQF